MIIAGVTVCLSHEFHNPLGKEKRQQYWDGLTSGDVGKTASTVAKAGWEMGNAIFNPTKMQSEIMGWKP